MPATAATTSAAWTAIEPGEEPIRWFMYGTIGLQTVVAAVAPWVAARRVVRRSRPAGTGSGGPRVRFR
ncbi:MAG: hypothetical protein AAGA93_24900, partial [Actinomycetota bacterium]